jgi:4-amino-4-deoxy-L-arabinose transferase-like glycosyltransferase
MSIGDALGAEPVAAGSVRERLTRALDTRTRVGRIPGVGRLLRRPELAAVMGLAAALNLWDLSINGWANTYYAAAIRSMSTSWHDFLYASLDKSGLMTVDKPPLSLWVQALSVRVFGLHPLSILVPQALMGVVAVGLLYDLTRRRFGRLGGFVAGLVLATTPIAVGVARHNNPDELLVLCSVAAVWFALRALEDGRTRWLILSGVCIGLGFETKMGVALMVLPGIAMAWLWLAPRGRLRAIRSGLAGLAATVVVAGAWPLLVMLTPAGDRPWIGGTSDNTILSLIFGYNGVGRLSGQSGGPGGGGPGGGLGGSALFGGPTGPFRLLQSALGDQAGWLLGFAIVVAVALLVLSKLRRSDPRSGWLLVVGGAFATSAVAFSFASGIFHPYYVSLLSPFTAALVGAGVGLIHLREPSRLLRALGPLALGAGIVTELAVLSEMNGSLSWAWPVVIVLAGGSAAWLARSRSQRLRAALIAVGLGALLVAPASWAAQTLGHAESSTFPAGGSASTAKMGLGPGGIPPGGGALGAGGPPGVGAAQGFGPPPALPGGGAPPGLAGFSQRGAAGQGMGAPIGASTTSLRAIARYVAVHGGGTIGVSSQSSAASAILATHTDFAGLGGFSGRESSISASWLAAQVRDGRLRWIVADNAGSFSGPKDNRPGSRAAISLAEKACRRVTIMTATGSTAIYDCLGRAGQISRS